MDILKTAIISVCFTSIAVGIIEALLPDNSYKTQLRLLTGAIIMMSLMLPIFRISGAELPDFDMQNITVNADEQLSSAAAATVKTQIESFLRQYEIDEAKISVITDIGADRCIIINKATVAVRAGDIEKASAAADAAMTALEINIEIEEIL